MATLQGTAGTDIIPGTPDPDYYNGGAGADSLTGLAGSDSLSGWTGNDTLDGGIGNDVIVGGAGTDTILGGDGDDAINGDNYLVVNPSVSQTYPGALDPSHGSPTAYTPTGGVALSLTHDFPGGAINVYYIQPNGDLRWLASVQPGNVVNITVPANASMVVGQGGILKGLIPPADSATSGSLNVSSYFDASFGETVADGAGDSINAGAGNDSVYGETGNDTIDGGDGSDQLFGGSGDDTISGGSGSDTVQGGTGNDLLSGDNDTATSITNNDFVTGGAGDDTILGGSGLDALSGGAGSDVVSGGTESDTISGGGGSDTIRGDDGNDFIRGDGLDALPLRTGTTQTVQGILGETAGSSATFPSGPGTTRNGTEVAVEIVNSSSVFQTVYYIQPDGTLVTDSMGVPAGQSRIFYFPSNANVNIVVVNYSTGEVTGFYENVTQGLTGVAAPATAIKAPNVAVTPAGNDLALQYAPPGAADIIDGGLGNDSIQGMDGGDSITGGVGADTIDGGVGNDTIWGGEENDSIIGGADVDSLMGDGGNDTISAGEGADFVDGGVGNDSLDGGIGNDTIRGGSENDIIAGGADDDSLTGDGGNDTIGGGDGADFIGGGVGDDSLDGGIGNDTISGGTENDSITGGGDNDSLMGDSGDDTLDGGIGNDTISGGTENDSITGGGDNDSLIGGSGVDTIRGGVGADIVQGGDDDDQLYGDDGNDTLDGGGDDDLIDGGLGADLNTGGAGFDTFIAGTGDTINDFNTAAGQDLGNLDQADNDFVDLSGHYNQANLDAYNAQALINGDDTYSHPLAWLRGDQADDGVLDDITGLTGAPDFTMTIQNGAAAVAAADLTWDNTNVVCFGADVLITTASGQVAAGDLVVGDMVETRDAGLQEIRWTCSRTLDAATLAANPRLRPIRIGKGALGAGLPHSDLIVSPQHRILVRSKIAQKIFGTNEVLVAARQLCQLPGIDVAEDLDRVTYVHFLFDAHQIVLANGAETESLFTGAEALKSVGPAAREEIFAIFPELELRTEAPIAARQLVSGRMGRKLATRHLQNRKPLVM